MGLRRAYARRHTGEALPLQTSPESFEPMIGPDYQLVGNVIDA